MTTATLVRQLDINIDEGLDLVCHFTGKSFIVIGKTGAFVIFCAVP